MEANPARLAGFSRREPQELMMSKKAEHDVIVALDLGTSKVVALVGEVNDNGRLGIIGLGSYPSRGMKKCADTRSWNISWK